MNKISAYSYIWNQAKSIKWFLLTELFISTVWATELTLGPYLIKLMVNVVEKHRSLELIQQITLPAAIYLGISLFTISLCRLADWLRLNYMPILRTKTAHSLMEYLLGHSHGYFQNQFAGNLANKVQNVSESTPLVVKSFFSMFVSQALAIGTAIIGMASVNIKFAIAFCVWIILFIGIAIIASKKMRQLTTDFSMVRSRNMGLFVDILTNASSIRLFGGKYKEKTNVNLALKNLTVASKKWDLFFFYIYAVQGIAFFIFQIICIVWLVQGAAQQTLTAGDFALILSLSIAIASILWDISIQFSEFMEHIGKVQEGLNLTTQLHEISDKPDAKELVVSQGKITFDNVNFHYKDATPLFSGKSINILPGQKVGLVGYSGSGKTTFVNLILRLFDIRSGKITIDVQNIQDVTQDSLRQSIAMIPQDPSLFHRSIAENIAYGMENVTQEQIIQAADNAHAHEFITRLPEQYEAMVGERGVKLSGGQRQRIAIARAFLKNSPILILDEATSQLDSVTEQLIQESLWKLMQGKTTLVIAHRLSTLLHMDRILVFEKGTIVQDGTHAELLKQKGLYKTLWSAQIGGFLDDQANLA